MIWITPEFGIPEDEISFSVSRSSGPGGPARQQDQHPRDPAVRPGGLPSLTPEQVTRLRGRLGARVSRAGILRVTAQRHRSQNANRQAAVERFAELLRDSLSTEPPRVASKPTRQQRERRLAAKRLRGRRKAERARVRDVTEED